MRMHMSDKGNAAAPKSVSRWGWLLYIPMWLLCLSGFLSLARTVFLSFTSYNVVEEASFVGMANYSWIAGDACLQQGIGNTVVFVAVVSVLLILTAVIPALFISRLPLFYGLVTMCGYGMISLSGILPGIYSYVFSNDAYGFLNGMLLNARMISQPIMWNPAVLKIFLLYVLSAAPVFAIAYIGTKTRRAAVRSALAVCTIPLVMFLVSHYTLQVIGYPSPGLAADWLPEILVDYDEMRYEVGFACALLVIGILLLACWCALVCCGVWLLSYLLQKAHRHPPKSKTPGYIAFSACMVLSLLLANVFLINAANALKPVDEFFMYPIHMLPLRPTMENFSNLFTYYKNTGWNFTYSFLTLFIYLPVYLVVTVPGAVGTALYKPVKKTWLLFLPCVGLLGFSPFIQLEESPVYREIGSFISGFGFAVLFLLTYAIVRMMAAIKKRVTEKWVWGLLSGLSSFMAVAGLTAKLCPGYRLDVPKCSWLQIHSACGAGDCAAGNVLICLFIAVLVLIPTVLMMSLYGVYRKEKLSAERELGEG